MSATAAPPAHAPARPAPATASAVAASELLGFALRTAADAAAVAALPLDPYERTWIRLDGPGGSEAWLIGWPPASGAGWHDHAESRGAFATARGSLTEHSLAARIPSEGWRSLELAPGVDRSRTLVAGTGRAFGQHHVHEVLNGSAEVHAVSVHVYHPPLPLIRRFSRSGRVLTLEQVERPQDWR
ncbi:cysteine dioxygenase [Streptomyces globosus]|uniref:cysteine dioxygenase n=1 Tax=Streptomyces globosus TaxID=68209 RepID=UPI00380B7D0A